VGPVRRVPRAPPLRLPAVAGSPASDPKAILRHGASSHAAEIALLTCMAPLTTMPANHDIYKAVVRLTNTTNRDKHGSLGSGVVFSPAGLVITNNHVIEDSDFGTAFGKITVESLQRVDRAASNTVPAELVIRNEVYDLAVVRIAETPPNHFIDLLKTPSTDASLMERRIRVLGYPPLGGGTITVTRGIVSGFDEDGNLKTDTEINRGNSGGAALDEFDRFLGVPSFISCDAEGKLGFIIPVDRIKEWFGDVLKSGVPQRSDQLEEAFVSSNLNYSGDNLDQSNRYPRILGKFAAVETLLSMGEYEKVLSHVRFILEKRPRSALAYHYLGNAFLGLGRYVDAAAQFRIALTHNPSHIPALGNLGVTLIHLSRYSEAIQIFEQIIDSTDNPAELWPSYNNIGRIYEIWGKEGPAQLYRQRAAELSAAAAERMSQYKCHQNSGDKVTALLDAMVSAEIKTEDESS